MTDHNSHLTAERVQAWLEGDLPPTEATTLEEHASTCARCRSEVEAWQLLFSELSELPAIAPPPDFARSVMDRIDVAPAPAPVSWAARVRAALGLGRGAEPARAGGHPAPERIQDYVEGILPGRALEEVRGHLAACRSCKKQEAQWRALALQIRAMPRHAPSPGFAQRVMSRVEVGQPVVAKEPGGLEAWGRRALEWLPSLRPRSKKGWALLAGAGMGPVAATMAVVAFVLANPLLTMGNLASFGWWQISEAASGFAQATGSALMESAVVFRAFSLLEVVSGSMGLVMVAAGAFSVLTVLSLWVLYRNLVNATPVELDEGYVPHYSF